MVGWLTDGGPNVTAIRTSGGSAHLRCFVQFEDVIRTNAHVTWHSDAGERLPVVRSTATSATTASPGCQSSKRRRRRRRGGGGVKKERRAAAGGYKCRVRWDRARPFVPDRLHHDFLTLAMSHNAPPFELCVTTDQCADSKLLHLGIALQLETATSS